MTLGEEHERLRRLRHLRIRRVKRLLRPLPRRANIHRYPFIRRFADTARKRMYLWSFRVKYVTPAIYAGFILSFMPLYGIQIPCSFFLALVMRVNLPILFGLQLITNPFTALPIYYANYQIGRSVLGLVGFEVSSLSPEEVMGMIAQLFSASWADNLTMIASVFTVTSLGGVVVATFLAVIFANLYRILAKRSSVHYANLMQRIQDHQLHHSTEREEPK